MKLEEYKKIVNKNSGKEDKFKNVFTSFIIGGIVGVICQAFCIFLNKEIGIKLEDASMYTTIMLIVVSSIFTGLGFFDKVVSFAKCGLIVPTTGFAHAMTSAAMDHKSEGPIKGIGSNMFKLAGSIIIYGIVIAFFLALIKGVIK
ncbi:MAG: SpoVA/SpoVAEb family sporulation membrane protein [Bacilli bacterium]|nr:SpoVA/SpoVAEb family sporulation membrane protein [Bacilli bacterium]